MAVLATSGLTLPKHLASGVWQKASYGSAVAQLSGQEPMLFGETQLMTFTGRPKAEYVAEGANKGYSDATFGTKTITPKKVQVTTRFNEEVQWADEDYQLGVLSTVSDSLGLALSRALDLGVIHGVNPIDGTAVSSITDELVTTTNAVEILDGTSANAPRGIDIDIETAVGLVIADGYRPNGIAIDPSYAWEIATARYTDGRKKYPEIGLTTELSRFEGFRVSVSDTVSAPEAAVAGGAYATTNPNVKAIVGDWDQLRWGVQRNIGLEVIRFGDPDGQGDLKRKNQIAIRAEVVYGWAVMDHNAFAKIVNATNES